MSNAADRTAVLMPPAEFQLMARRHEADGNLRAGFFSFLFLREATPPCTGLSLEENDLGDEEQQHPQRRGVFCARRVEVMQTSAGLGVGSTLVLDKAPPSRLGLGRLGDHRHDVDIVSGRRRLVGHSDPWRPRIAGVPCRISTTTAGSTSAAHYPPPELKRPPSNQFAHGIFRIRVIAARHPHAPQQELREERQVEADEDYQPEPAWHSSPDTLLQVIWGHQK